MTTILQISDTHIVAEGKLVSGRLETTDPLEKLVKRLSTYRASIGDIDAVLVSGDISDDGSAESYQRFKWAMSELALPTYLIPGNHDAREPMRTAFQADGYFPEQGYLNWSKQINDVQLIGLDTLIEGQGGGMLAPETLAFLTSSLEHAGGAPVLLALHHPPFKSDIKFMDDIGLKNITDLAHVLEAYSGELRLVCGHIHSLMIANVGKHIAVSAPSPCSTFDFDTRENAVVGFNLLQDGCLLHRWPSGSESGAFQTIRIGPEAGNGPYPF